MGLSYGQVPGLICYPAFNQYRPSHWLYERVCDWKICSMGRCMENSGVTFLQLMELRPSIFVDISSKPVCYLCALLYEWRFGPQVLCHLYAGYSSCGYLSNWKYLPWR